MARYSVRMNIAASHATNAVGAVITGGTRLRITDFAFSSDATPADHVNLVQLQRSTTVGTATSVTPQALDPADAASSFTAKENYTSNGTLTSGAVYLTRAVNTRSTYEWHAAPGREIVIPTTSNNGIHVLTPTASGDNVYASVKVQQE